MYFDYHMHTSFSADSKANIDDMCQAAIKNNLVEIAITDHVDIEYPDPEFDFSINYDDYRNAIMECQLKYRNELSVLTGLELGLQPHIGPKVLDFIKYKHFDYIIGSMHTINKLDLYQSPYFDDKTREEAFTGFLEETIECIKKVPYFNVLGHFDVVRRYCPYDNKSLKYSDFTDLLDELLKQVAYNGKGIEINTSGFKYGLEEPLCDLEILKRYKEIGGEIITMGSDAHSPEFVGNHFKEATELLKAAGFTHLTRYFAAEQSFISIL